MSVNNILNKKVSKDTAASRRSQLEAVAIARPDGMHLTKST